MPRRRACLEQRSRRWRSPASPGREQRIRRVPNRRPALSVSAAPLGRWSSHVARHGILIVRVGSEARGHAGRQTRASWTGSSGDGTNPEPLALRQRAKTEALGALLPAPEPVREDKPISIVS
ncbi:hypothetical protein B2J93_6219 [Marssonina coronariae]|uniref:Uncharacterized protein n=1 Tax=Diplocarpon coronariae TaxID=2795749 RepID=A0A218ZF53_9HELO|nr:hypothetical protein B2J93_6219 [Marssonina coronariae]